MEKNISAEAMLAHHKAELDEEMVGWETSRRASREVKRHLREVKKYSRLGCRHAWIRHISRPAKAQLEALGYGAARVNDRWQITW